MIRHEFELARANWHVVVYHAVDAMWADEILDDLIRIGCNGRDFRLAKQSLWSGKTNSGLTYSNCDRRETVMVIGLTSSGAEYWNSLDHEKNHLLQDIALTDDIDPYGEEISYISGEFTREVYKKANGLLCDCCRKKAVGMKNK